MSILLNLGSDSDNAEGTGSRYETAMAAPILLDRHQPYEVALTAARIWNAFPNVSAEFDNNKFKYSPDSGSTWYTVTLADGSWTVSSLNAALQAAMKANGHSTTSGGLDVYYISIAANPTTLRTRVTITDATYRLDLQDSTSKMHNLLGFNSQIISATKEGENRIDILNGVTSVMIRSDLVSGSYVGGQQSDVLFSFVPSVDPGFLCDVTPTNLLWLPLHRYDHISRVRIVISDQNGRELNLRGEDSFVQLYIRKRAV